MLSPRDSFVECRRTPNNYRPPASYDAVGPVGGSPPHSEGTREASLLLTCRTGSVPAANTNTLQPCSTDVPQTRTPGVFPIRHLSSATPPPPVSNETRTLGRPSLPPIRADVGDRQGGGGVGELRGCAICLARASAAQGQAHHFLHFTRNPWDFGKDLPFGGCIEPRL